MIVERAKKCLDFTSTLYIIHLGMCSFYDGIPQNWEWWILQMASLALMVVLGETRCAALLFELLLRFLLPFLTVFDKLLLR